MKKFILLILLCLILTGCKAKYTLNINEDLSVEETMVGLEDEEFYKKYYNSSKDRVIEFSTIFYQDYLKKYNYEKEKVVEGEYTGQKVSTKFDTLENYFSSSEAYKQFYKEWKHDIKDGIVTIELKDKLEKNGNCYDRYIIDECDVSVILPFKVIEHNADNYDKATNTYTWKIDIDEPKDIYIEFDTNLLKKDSFMYIVYIIIGALIIAAVAFLTIYFKKNKEANKF